MSKQHEELNVYLINLLLRLHFTKTKIDTLYLTTLTFIVLQITVMACAREPWDITAFVIRDLQLYLPHICMTTTMIVF